MDLELSLGQRARWHLHGVLDLLRALGLRVLCRFAEKRCVLGVELAAASGDPTADRAFLDKMSEALSQLAHVSPSRLARMASDLPRVVFVHSGAGYYLRPLNAFITSKQLVDPIEASELALHYVHESTHARLHQSGFRYTPETMGRHESICLKAELSTALLLPNGESLYQRRASLVETEWWTMSNRKKRNERSAMNRRE